MRALESNMKEVEVYRSTSEKLQMAELSYFYDELKGELWLGRFVAGRFILIR